MNLFRSPLIFKAVNAGRETRKTAFVPAFPGCGVTFITVQRALFEAENVNVVELGKPSLYLSFDMGKRFLDREFVFYEDIAASKSISCTHNTEFGINWLLRRPEAEDLPFEIMLKAICSPPPGITLYDMSSVSGEHIMLTLPEMDEIFIVIDPMPSKLIAASEFLEKLLLSFPSAKLIVNKMNKGVYKNELRRFLGSREYREIPFYPPEEIYRAEFNCCPPTFT